MKGERDGIQPNQEENEQRPQASDVRDIKQSVSYRDVSGEKGSSVASAVIIKPIPIHDLSRWHIVGRNLDIEATIVEKVFALKGFGRDRQHLLRLLSQGRSKAETDFGNAYLEHIAKIREDIRNDQELFHKVQSCIGSESADSTMFWTFAPYLFKVLQEKGVSREDAIKSIIHWTRDGNSLEDAILHLKGFDYLKKLAREAGVSTPLYILSTNPDGASHRFTEQEAKRIVNEYFV